MTAKVDYIGERLKNIANEYINPATYEGQQEIITAISGSSGGGGIGGATAAKQDVIITAINGVTTPSDVQPISATSLPLPTGAATETGIQEVVTAIEGINIPPPVGGATEIQQETLNTLVNALYELAGRLTFLTGVKGVLADLRVTPTGTVTVAGSLTTLTTLSNIGSWSGNPHIPATTNMAAIQSNITNISL